MRYSVPRSLSPSPVRRQSRSTYGISLVNYSDSDKSSDSEEELCYDSEPDVPPAPAPVAKTKSTPEQRHVEETIAAIRLRTRHHDPYEEWEKQTRKDAFRVARKDHATMQVKLLNERDKAHTEEEHRLAAIHARQLAEVEGLLSSLKIQQQREEDSLKRGWQERDRALWARIDAGIKVEEDKVRVKLDAERKVLEEQESKIREEEARKKAEEDRKRREEEETKRAAEEKERLRVEEEKRKQEDERRQAQDEQDKAARLAAEADGRKAIGITTAEDDWRMARSILLTIKADTMKPIKADKARRSVWGDYRRKITPKIGQLTNDSSAIRDITTFIQSQIMLPNPPHPPMLYTGLCSSLAKAILLQAETEVTAEKKAAIPLAQMTSSLLETLPFFPDVLFAKLSQRCGTWAIPCTLPANDITGQPWKDDEERAKVLGYRRSVEENVPREPVGEYMQRVAGCMRVYFAVLRIPPSSGRPMHPMFQMPRLWVWFARLLGSERMLESPVAAQLMYTALDVVGSHALQVWGHQWVKMLELVYSGATIGFADKKLVGGPSPEGIAARSRLKMEIERIMAGGGK
ncbi:GLE1-like protein-domain-containing protein [Mycena amicta]|nr:GLE1-like protein-domain-containing protein [Mycena amicta]